MWRKLICLIFIFSLPQSLTASHLLGSRISWENVGFDSFRVSVKVFRECSGEELVPPKPEIRCKDHQQPLTPPIQRLKVKRQIHSPSCDKYCTACKADTCKNNQPLSNHGFKSIKATYLVDLTSINCCRIAFAYQNCCRPTALTTLGGPNQKHLYASAWVNKCKANGTGKNAFQEVPKFTFCTGKPAQLPLGKKQFASNKANIDSIKYKLVKPKKGPNKPLKWSNPYSAQLPLRFEGFPNKDKKSPAGFHLNHSTGLLAFIPTRKQRTTIAIAAKCYKDGSVIGTQLQDFAIKTINCKNNKSPEVKGFSNNLSYTDSLIACAGDTASLIIQANDPNLQDTLSASIDWEKLPGKLLNKKRQFLSNTETAWTFKWIPADSINDVAILDFYATVKDQHCPFNGSDRKKLHLQVLPKPSASFETKVEQCQTISLKAGKTLPPPFKQQWWLGGNRASDEKQFIFDWQNAGERVLRHRVSAGECEVSSRSTLDLGSLAAIKGQIPTYCAGDTVNLQAKKPSYMGENQTIIYQWLGKSGQLINKGPNFHQSVDSTKKVKLLATLKGDRGSLVCKDTASYTIRVKDFPEIKFNPIPSICGNKDSFNLNKFVKPRNGEWFISGELTEEGWLRPSEEKSGLHNLTYRLTDSINGCTTAKQTSVNIKPVKKFAEFSDTAICRRNKPLVLTTSNRQGTFKWSGKGLFDVNQGLKFDPAQANLPVDTYKLKATFTPENEQGCAYNDTLEVALFREGQFSFPQQEICPYDSLIPKSFSNMPEGGYWQSQANNFDIERSKILRRPQDSGSYVANYYLNGNCRLTTNVDFKLIPEKPLAINVQAFEQQPLCTNQDKVALEAQPSGGNWYGPGVDKEQEFHPSKAGSGHNLIAYEYPHEKTGCVSKTTDTVHINHNPLVDFKASELSICPGKNILKDQWLLRHQTNIKSNFKQTSTTNANLQLSGKDSFKLSIQNPSRLPDSTLLITKALPQQGCDASKDSIIIIKRSKPDFSISRNGTRKACKFVQGQLKLQSKDSLKSIRWRINNDISNGKSLFYNLGRKGTHNLGIIASNQFGCVDSSWNAGYFEVLEKPTAKYKINKQKLYLPEKVHLKGFPRSANFHKWQVKKDQKTVAEIKGRQISYNPLNTGNYTVKHIVKTKKRCVDTAVNEEAFKVLRKPIVYIPSAFTPNGDGINDKFYVKGRNIADFHLEIFSRSGALLYKTSSYDEHGWNGQFQGSMLPSGSYWYALSIRGALGEKQTYSGTFKLIR